MSCVYVVRFFATCFDGFVGASLPRAVILNCDYATAVKVDLPGIEGMTWRGRVLAAAGTH